MSGRGTFAVRLAREACGAPAVVMTGRGEASPLTAAVLSELFPQGRWEWTRPARWWGRRRLEWTCEVRVAERRPRPPGWCSCGEPWECRCDPRDQVAAYAAQVRRVVTALATHGIRCELGGP